MERADPRPRHVRRPGQSDRERVRPWSPPRIKKLPPLTDLTLQTGDPVQGGVDGGSTVF